MMLGPALPSVKDMWHLSWIMKPCVIRGFAKIFLWSSLHLAVVSFVWPCWYITSKRDCVKKLSKPEALGTSASFIVSKTMFSTAALLLCGCIHTPLGTKPFTFYLLLPESLVDFFSTYLRWIDCRKSERCCFFL